MASIEGLGIPIWNDAAVREVIQEAKGPLFLATTKSTKLDDMATETYRAAPADLARLGLAIAHVLDEQAPPVTDLPESLGKLIDKIARALKEAEKPLVVCGTSAGSQELLQAAANVAWALGDDERQARLFMVMPEANSFGLGLMEAKPLQAALEAVQKNEADTVIILENDLSRRVNPPFLASLREAARNIIVLDSLENDTTKMADLILPAATFAEGDGTLVNNEGRAQRFYQVFVPQGEVQESWRWLQAMGQTAGWESASEWQDLDDVVADLSAELPVFAPVTAIVPPADYLAVDQKIPRQPHRYSGRTAMRANLDVHEPKPPEDPDTPLSFSMEGYKGRPPAELIPRYWTPGWNSVQALNKFQQEVGKHLHGDGSGQRLVEAASEPTYHYFDQIPQPFEPRTEAGEWLALPQYHIFGSEPSSMLASGVAELAPPPYLALHPNDANQIGMGEGESIRLQIDEVSHAFPVQFDASLPPGTTGFPVGLPGMPSLSLPAWVQLSKEEVS
jgi:NADH-quinone oxidoreductase subunit G